MCTNILLNERNFCLSVTNYSRWKPFNSCQDHGSDIHVENLQVRLGVLRLTVSDKEQALHVPVTFYDASSFTD